ncbi:MAG: NF038130 family PEP-CTERM protein [Spirulina sp.]
MKGIAQKLLVGTSVLVGAIATSTPALASTLSNVNMFGNLEGTLVYSDNGSGVGVPGVIDPVTALTDGDRYSHVELNSNNELLTDNDTGFTGNLGLDAITVEGITQADWDGGLGTQWMADFALEYPTVAAALDTANTMFGVDLYSEITPRSGDPNVAYMAKNDANGDITIDLIGHYNVWEADWMAPYLSVIDTAFPGLTNEALQISEIAKVTINGQEQYVYGFSAEQTGVVAGDDGKSHSGRYTVTLLGAGTPETPEGVPEPSIVLGLMTVGGLLAASKRKSEKA